jgi:hypothetical protein
MITGMSDEATDKEGRRDLVVREGGRDDVGSEVTGVLVHVLAWLAVLNVVLVVAVVFGVTPVDVARWVLGP